MAAKFYFFTEPDLLSPSQPSAAAFGPTAVGGDEYRTTSKHTASTAVPKAYAICDGIVCVQRSDLPGLVNLVLRPLVQPPLNFSPVKCFIYKGIREGSLIDGTKVAPAVNNDLTASLWETQAKKNQATGTTADAPAAALGVDMAAVAPPGSPPGAPVFPDGDPIERLFHQAGGDFQLPVVKGGWCIGELEPGGFGLEVLMEGLSFKHTLALARTHDHVITVPALAGGETAAQVFDHWHEKEQVLGFMDPCAFYGSFFRAGVQARRSTDGSFSRKAGNDLYHDVLYSFANRNTAYLDIRNEHNGSLDYFGNYGRDIQVDFDPANPGPVLVPYYGGGWPILTLAAADFPASNTNGARNPFRIQLPVGDNAAPLLYVSQGYRDIGSKGNGFPEELSSADRFFDGFTAPGPVFTTTGTTSALSSMTFVVPNVTGQGATTPVSCYLRLRYLKQQAAPTASAASTAVRADNYLDNLIYPFDLGVPLASTTGIVASVYEEEVYVDAQAVAGVNCDFIGRVGVARDAADTTFFVVPTSIRKQAGRASAVVSLVGEATDAAGSYAELVASKYSQQQVQPSFLTVAGSSVPVAKFASAAAPEAKQAFAEPDFDKLVLFSVQNSACDAWSSTATPALDDRFRTYLGVKNLQTPADDAGTEYTSFELSLRGYAPDAVTGGYAVQEVSTGVVVPASDATVYAPGREKVTCDIAPGTGGRPSTCIPTNGSIQLTGVPSSGTGTFLWKIVDSTGQPAAIGSRIKLSNANKQTVTVKAKGQVSLGVGAEKVQLAFTPQGSTDPPIIRTRDVTVISVAFSASSDQSYGYDNMDLNGDAHHVSIKSGDTTKVHVAVLGGGTADDLEFSSGDVTIATPVPPLPGTGDAFELTISAGNKSKDETSIVAKCKGGPVCATLMANVYQRKECNVTVIRVQDPNVTATKLQAAWYDRVFATMQINSSYKAAVATIVLDDYGADEPESVAYDLDHDGYLALEPTGSNELDVLKNFCSIASGQRVFLVHRMLYMFKLAQPASQGDTAITFKQYGNHLTSIQMHESYDLGSLAGTEPVTFSHAAGEVFTLDPLVHPNGLNGPHAAGDGIIMWVAGLTFGGTDVCVVEEPASPQSTSLEWVIAHEIGHALLKLSDLNAPTNLMNYANNWSDQRLRYKPEPLRTPITQQDGSTLTKQCQWQAIPRP